MKDKDILGTIFALDLVRGRTTVKSLAERTNTGRGELKEILRRLQRKRLVGIRGERVRLMEKGRALIRVVFIGGGFEIIHPGHIYTISQAKKLGDALVVVIARDSTIRRRKGREPVASEAERLALLSSLRQVDAAILGVEGDIYETLEKVRPDVVALGYDQHHAEADIIREGTKRGMKLKVVRLGAQRPEVKTSRLLSET